MQVRSFVHPTLCLGIWSWVQRYTRYILTWDSNWQASHMHRLREELQFCCSLGMLKAMGLRWTQGLKQSSWCKPLKPVMPSLESSANPCPRQWQSYLSSRHTHFGVPEAGSIDNSCCHCLFFICNIPRQLLHWVLPYSLCFFHHLLQVKADFIRELGTYKPAVNLPRILARNYTDCTEYIDKVKIKFPNI